jgi:hypothetical protein
MITAPIGGKVPMIATDGPDIPDLLLGGLLIINASGAQRSTAGSGNGGISGAGAASRGSAGADRIRYALYLAASGSWS